MKYSNPNIRVELKAVRFMEKRLVIHHSVRLVRVVALDVEQLTCGTFSSPSEGYDACSSSIRGQNPLWTTF